MSKSTRTNTKLSLTRSTPGQPFYDVNRYADIICNIADSRSHSGKKSIELGYPRNEAGVELRVDGFGPTKTLYTRKYEYYAAGWEGNWPAGLKTSRYFSYADTSEQGCDAGDKSAYMSEKLIWMGSSKNHCPISGQDNSTCDVAAGMNNAIGNLDLIKYYEPDEIFGNGLPYIRTGHWYKFETWMVLNSAIDAKNGVLKIWIDDVLVYSNESVAWKSSARNRPCGSGWDSMWFGGNYSGASLGGPNRTVYRYIDDLYLSTTLDRENTGVPPDPPTGLKIID